MISFKAIVCLLETPITEEVQIKGLEVLKRLDKHILLMHTRYFKVLESIITSLKEEHLYTIIDIISSSIIEMLKLKQGYFLLRKILKNAKQICLQDKIVSLITDRNFIEFMSHNNGCLLSQCIVRNFMVDKGKLVMNNSQSFNKQIIKKAYNAAQTDKVSESQTKEERCIEDKDYAPLSRFFDNFLLRIFPKYPSFNFSKSVSKSHKKILEAFFEVGSKYFKIRFSQILLLSNSRLKTSIVRQILNLSNDSLESFQTLLIKQSDCPKMFKKLPACLETVSLKGLANELIMEWNSFLINLKNNNEQSGLDSPMRQLNIKSQGPSKRAFVEEANPNFKNKLFIRIEDLADLSSENCHEDSENQFEDFVCTNQTFFEDNENVKNYAEIKVQKQKLKKKIYLKPKANIIDPFQKEQSINSKVPVDPFNQQVHPSLRPQEAIQFNKAYYPNNQIIINQMQYMSYDFKPPSYNSSSIIYYPIYSNGLLLNQGYVRAIPQSHSASLYIGTSQNGASPKDFSYIPKKYN